MGLPRWLSSKESACQAGDVGLIPGLGMIPWRRKWQPTPVFLPGESQGWRSLVGYSPWGRKESDMTERRKEKDHCRDRRGPPESKTPETVAQQSPPSLGFSRQEHWSGLPFPSPVHESEVAQLCPTLCDPMDYSPPDSLVHGILQARILEWVASLHLKIY